MLDSLFYAHPNEKVTTTVHQISLPPSTGERSEGAHDEPSKRKDFKDVQKERKEKSALSAPLPLSTTNYNSLARFYEHHANRLNHTLFKH